MTIDRAYHESVLTLCRARVVLSNLKEVCDSEGEPHALCDRALLDIELCEREAANHRPTMEQLQKWEEETKAESGWLKPPETS